MDLESMEAISQDAHSRAVCLRLEQMSQHGRLRPFLLHVERADDIDDEMKARVAELAADEDFLHTFALYVRSTRALH